MGSALGVGFPPPGAPHATPPTETTTPAEETSANAQGSDILDAKSHELRLEPKDTLLIF